MNKQLFAAFVLFFFTINTGAQQNPSIFPQHRIIMQLSSNDTLVWKGLMNNLRNLKAGWGDSVAIEVVVHGPGLDLLTRNKTTQQGQITQFKKAGISFQACENSMLERKVPKEAMIAEAGYVKMAMAEIVRKQEEGWSYIKIGF